MNAFSNFKRLASLSGEAQIKALAEAVNFELGLVNDYIAVQGGKASGTGVLLPDGKQRESSITIEGVKSFLGQKYVTPSDTPGLVAAAPTITSYFHTSMPEIDLAWTNLFTYIDLRGGVQTHFDIIDTNAGVTFEQKAPGEPVKIRRGISENKTTVPYVTYADGIGILDDWMRFQQFWNVEQAVTEFRAKSWDKMAEIHYGLLTAQSSGIDVAFDTDDTKTFNKAAAAMFRAVRSSGYAVGQNAGVWLVTSPEQKGRVLKMLEATQGSLIVAYDANKQPISYNVAGVISTTFVAAADTGYYMVLPGRKMQRGNWMDLSIESNRDIYKRANDWVGTMQFNAAIGDTAQVRRVKFA